MSLHASTLSSWISILDSIPEIGYEVVIIRNECKRFFMPMKSMDIVLIVADNGANLPAAD